MRTPTGPRRPEKFAPHAPVRLAVGLVIVSIAHGCAWLAPALAQDAGETQFKTSCGVCHSADKDAPPRQGPNLNAVFGRPAGQLPDFKYSDAMKASKLVWDEATLDTYLTDPQELVPNSVMPYKQANPDKRKLIIGYLKSLKPQ